MAEQQPHEPQGHLLQEAERYRRLELGELQRRHTAYYALGRVLMATLFIIRGVFKLRYFDASLSEMRSEGFKDSALMMPIAIAVEVGAGFLLAIGYQARAAALTLMSYVVMLTLIFNWDLRVIENQELASLHLALVGGLLAILGHGSGAFSVDRLRARRAKQHHA